MAINDIVQTIAEARVDARSLSEFVFKPAGFKVARRLAPPVDTLQFYIDRFNSLNGDFSSSVSVALSSLNNSVAEADGKVAYIESTVQDAINSTAVEGGILADTFLTVENTINQRQVNRGFESVDELLNITNPKDGLRVYVKSYHAGLGKGGGDFVYDSTRATENDGGVVINGWVRVGYSNNLPVKLSWFGAKPDSMPSANSNEICLMNALKYIDVIVDGYYYITAEVGAVINNSISLSGEGNNSGFAITSASVVFWIKITTADYLTLNNIAIYCDLGNSSLTLFSPNEKEDLLGELKVTNCRYYGKQRLFRGAWSDVLDANEFKFGIDRVSFVNNYIEGTGLFLFLINSCTTYAEIIDNEAKNISRVLFNFSIDKEDTKYSIKDNLRHLLVSGNTVINDDDFYATDIVGYLCFVLYTGQSCTYKNNWVEGLKTREDAAVYDAYLSSTHLVYDSNTNKNNVCLFSGKTMNELIKAKGSFRSTHSNSHFIVEREFLERHDGLGADVCWVSLFEKSSGDDTSIARIINNVFDAYWILHQISTNAIRSLEITGNTFNCHNMTGTMVIKSADYPDITSFETAHVDVSDNIFNVSNTGIPTLVGTSGTAISAFRFFTIKQNEGDTQGFYNQLRFSNNTINIGKVYGTFETGSSVVNNVLMQDNNFKFSDMDAGAKIRPMYPAAESMKTASIQRNNIVLTGSASLSTDALAARINTDAPTTFSVDVSGLWAATHSTLTKPATGSCKVVVTRKVLSELGFLNWKTEITLTQTGVSYVDSLDAPQNADYPATGTTTIQPLKKPINGSDALTDYNPIAVYPSTTTEVVRINHNLPGYVDKKVIHSLTIETIPF